MFNWLLLLTGIVGFGLAAYWDLKTTEFPDWLPYSMIVAALLVRGAYAWVEQNLSILFSSVFVGLVFLGFGLALYYAKQWGDGDAWLLGVLGFLFPDSAGFFASRFLPFPLVLIFNFFFVAFVYLIIYSLVLGIKSPKIAKKFFPELKNEWKRLTGYSIFILAVTCTLSIYMYYMNVPVQDIHGMFLFPVLFVFVLLFAYYGKFVEKNLFRKRIPVEKLRPGDVLVNEKWKGLTKEDIKKLKKKGGYVWIKEGVRFAPVFIITLLVSLFYGNMLGMLLGFGF